MSMVNNFDYSAALNSFLEVDGVALPEMEEGVTDEHAEEDDEFVDVK